MLYFVIAIVGFVILCWGVDLYRNRHPLNAEESFRLAEKYRRNRALGQYSFWRTQTKATPEEKKVMRPNGEFVSWDCPYHVSPSKIAGLLKYKKHEWIVFAFVKDKRVIRLWWNKGPDGTMVWPVVREDVFYDAIEVNKPDVLLRLHNHPNGNPSRYSANIPSGADLNSAAHYHSKLMSKQITFLDFICERGTPYLYYAAFPNNQFPLQPLLADIGKVNGSSFFKNYSLRKTLARRTEAEMVAGAEVFNTQSRRATS
jgi:hypothetical protein